jgi:CRP-like cAMP-binding protein
MMINHESMLARAPEEIKSHMHKKTYEKGSYIIRSGEENDSLYFLTEGTAEVAIFTYKGTTQTMKLLKAYEVFGELEIFNPSLKTNSIIAKSKCTVIRIHRDYIFEWLKLDPEFSKYLLELIASFYTFSISQSAKLSTMTIKQRLLVSLYLHHQKGDLSSLTKEFLLQEILVPKRSLNRSLKECIEEGYVTYKKKQFHVVDEDYLLDYVEPLL